MVTITCSYDRFYKRLSDFVVNHRHDRLFIRITLPFVMPSSDSRGAGRSCITTYIVVDILPQSASADGIITTKHLHFRIKQEEIDCKQRNLVSWIDFVCLLINIYRIRIVRFVKRKHCCRSASNSTNHCFDLITYGSTFTYAKIRNIIKDVLLQISANC